MTPKQYAEQLYNKYYAIIFELGEELSQEIVISLLAKECAQQVVKELDAFCYGEYEPGFLAKVSKELDKI